MLTASMASNFWGVPRTTHDLDFVLSFEADRAAALGRTTDGGVARRMLPPSIHRVSLMNRVVGFVVAAGMLSAAAQAQVVRNVTSLLRTQTTAAALDSAGGIAFAISNADPYGTNPAHAFQLFRWDPVTGAGQQITNIPGGVDVDPYMFGPSVTDDGTKVAFLLDRRLALVNADGTGLAQLTTTPADIVHFQIAGNGSRVVFDSTANLVGSNPNGFIQVFAVESNGTGLRQLTSHTAAGAGMAWPSISDNGTRIVYLTTKGTVDSSLQIAGVFQDGTGYRLLTNLAQLRPGFVQLSGNGVSAAFQVLPGSSLPRPPGGCDQYQVALVNWNVNGLTSLFAPCVGAIAGSYAGAPDITDDAQTVFFAADNFGKEINRINRDRTGWTPITDTTWQPGPKAVCDSFVRIAGSGSRAAFTCYGGEPWGGPNADFSNELYAGSGTGTGKLQLTRLLEGDSRDPDLTADGSLVVFSSTARPDGGTGYAIEQLFKRPAAFGPVTQITEFTSGGATQASVTDAGDVVVFVRDYQVFAIGTDGTNPRQLTPEEPSSYVSDLLAPRIAGNGSVVVFRSFDDLLLEGDVAGCPIYRVSPDGWGLMRLTSKTGCASFPRVDATGTWMATSVEGSIHRVKTDGTVDQIIGSGTPYGWVDISGDGGLVVYDSAGNPVGANPDGSRELFLWTASSGITRQLTSSPSGRNIVPEFSPDGAWVYFWSDAPRYGWELPNSLQPYRVEVATGSLERVGGLIGCTALPASYVRPIPSSLNGSIAVFGARGACTEANVDGSSEIWLIDRTTTPSIRISPGPAPTEVSWDVESGPVFYDVIRGTIDSLAAGAGGTVDLGAVTCVENDSTDSSTANAPDPALPLPGQAFFYLYRATPGAPAGPGSYGQSSGGGERIPGSGGCGG